MECGATFGRDAELEHLADLLTGAVPSDAVLFAAPGAGATTVLRCVEGRLLGRGGHVWWIEADRLDRVVPFSSLRRSAMATSGPGPVMLAARRLTEVLAAAQQPSVWEVAAALSDLLAALQAEAPTVLAVDALSHLDPDSCVALADALERNPGVRVVCAAHPYDLGEPASSWVERPGWHEVHLGPLADAAIASLAAGCPEDEVDDVCRRAAGNPLIAHALVRELTGDVPLEGRRARRLLERLLPEGTCEVAQALAFLEAPSVGGLEVAARLLGRAGADDLRIEHDALVVAGVLTGDDAGFANETVRDLLRAAPGPATMRHWHKVAFDCLRGLPPSAELDRAVARHGTEAVDAGEAEAIRAVSSAAARATLDWPEAAVGWFGKVLDLTEPVGDSWEAAVTGYVRALLLAGRSGEAAEVGTVALQAVTGGRARARLAALVVAATGVAARPEDLGVVELLDSRSDAPALTAAHAALALSLAGRDVEASSLHDTSIDRVASLGPGAELQVVIELLHGAAARDVGPIGELAGRVAHLSSAAPDGMAAQAHTAAAFALVSAGRPLDAFEHLKRASLLVLPSQRHFCTEVAVATAWMHAHLGDWDAAVNQALEAELALADGGSSAYAALLRVLRAHVSTHRGDFAQVASDLQGGPPDLPTGRAMYAVALADAHFVSGNLSAARAELAGHVGTEGITRITRGRVHAVLAEVAAEAGDQNAVHAALESLGPEAASELAADTWIRCRIARGRSTRDADDLAAAAELAGRLGLRLLEARCRLHLGAFGVDAATNLTEAARAFGDLGAAPWRRRAVALMRDRGLPVPRRRRRSSAVFSETEAQIAKLVQAGQSNREIAAAMFLSPKTVESYLTKMYARAGCSGRIELARALDRNLV